MKAKVNVVGGELDVTVRDGEIVMTAVAEGFPVSFSLVLTGEQALELRRRLADSIDAVAHAGGGR